MLGGGDGVDEGDCGWVDGWEGMVELIRGEMSRGRYIHRV